MLRASCSSSTAAGARSVNGSTRFAVRMIQRSIARAVTALATMASLRILLDVLGLGLVVAFLAVQLGPWALLGAGVAVLVLNAYYGQEASR